MPKVTVDVPKVTRRRAKSDLGDAKTRFLFRLALKERESFNFLSSGREKGKKLRNPDQSSIGRAGGWKIVNSEIVTARRHAKSDPSMCQK